MAVAYVTHSKRSVASSTVTVPDGTDRLLVVITISTNAGYAPFRLVLYGGVALSAATNSNDWVQIHYMLDPPVGDATLSVSGTEIDRIVDAHYTGVGHFQEGSQGSVSSQGATLVDAGVLILGLESDTSGHTPLAGSTTREDFDQNWYGDRIESAAGTYSCGVLTTSDPHSAMAVFIVPQPDLNTSGTPSAPKATATGSATVRVAPTGAVSAPNPSATGSALLNTVVAAGTPSAPIPTATGSADTLPTVIASNATALSPTAYGDVILHGAGRPHALIPRTPRPRASVRET